MISSVRVMFLGRNYYYVQINNYCHTIVSDETGVQMQTGLISFSEYLYQDKKYKRHEEQNRLLRDAKPKECPLNICTLS